MAEPTSPEGETPNAPRPSGQEAENLKKIIENERGVMRKIEDQLGERNMSGGHIDLRKLTQTGEIRKTITGGGVNEGNFQNSPLTGAYKVGEVQEPTPPAPDNPDTTESK
jgi:hypothetical protein